MCLCVYADVYAREKQNASWCLLCAMTLVLLHNEKTYYSIRTIPGTLMYSARLLVSRTDPSFQIDEGGQDAMCSNQIAVFCHVASLDRQICLSRALYSCMLCHFPLPPSLLPPPTPLPPFLPSSLGGKTELDKTEMMRLALVVCVISTDKHS